MARSALARLLRTAGKRVAARPGVIHADDLARQIRELDVRIQQSNWEFDLME